MTDELDLVLVSFGKLRIFNPDFLDGDCVIKLKSARGAFLGEFGLLGAALLALVRGHSLVRWGRILAMLEHLFTEPKLVFGSKFFQQAFFRLGPEELVLEPANECSIVLCPDS